MEDFHLPWEVKKRIIEIPTIGLEVCVIGVNDPEWASDINKYLDTGELPKGKKEARKTRGSAVRFIKVDRVLYKSCSPPTSMHLTARSIICSS